MTSNLESIDLQADLERIKAVARCSGAEISANLSDEQATEIWSNVSMMQGEEWLPVPQSQWEIWSYISSQIGDLIKGHDQTTLAYRWDIDRIISVARNHGVMANARQAYDAWSDFSNMMAAGWMEMPEDNNALWRDVGDRLISRVL